MCLQCGCGLPYDKMGEDNNLVYDDIKRAVETTAAKGLSAEQAIQNIMKTWDKVSDEDKQYTAA